MTHPYTKGKSYLIRTVTHYYVGRLVEVYQAELVLTNVSWVADTGRYSDALRLGTLKEVEPLPGSVIIGRGGIIEVAEWNHSLPATPG